VLLLLLAAGAAGSAFVLARRPGPVSAARYACPMHPEVAAPGPGGCSICGMALEPLATNGPRAVAAAGEGRADVADARSVDVETIEPRVFAQEVRAPARLDDDGHGVSALLYADEREALAPGEPGWFASTAQPRERIAVRATNGPSRHWDEATSLVPFRVEGRASPGIRPGDVGWLTIAARPRRLRVVTTAAVIDSPEGPSLFVAPPESGAFTKRRVEIGRSFFGVTVVTAGVADGERIAVGNAFFFETDRRLRGDADPPSGVPP
jgi:hypothetical protein